MPEGNFNAEIASHLREQQELQSGGEGHMRLEILEILEAILLAIVAISTALSGYQAAKWDGVSGRDYATASRLRVQSEQASLTSNQTIIYNSGNLTAWLQADTSGDTKLAAILARRFTPNYEVAFKAWLKTDPLTNASAPPGPRYMPQYKDPLAAQATALSDQSTQGLRERGRLARHRRQVRAPHGHPGGRAVPGRGRAALPHPPGAPGRARRRRRADRLLRGAARHLSLEPEARRRRFRFAS